MATNFEIRVLVVLSDEYGVPHPRSTIAAKAKIPTDKASAALQSLKRLGLAQTFNRSRWNSGSRWEATERALLLTHFAEKETAAREIIDSAKASRP